MTRRPVWARAALLLVAVLIGAFAAYELVLFAFTSVVASRDDAAFPCSGSGNDQLATCVSNEPAVITGLDPSGNIELEVNGGTSRVLAAYPPTLSHVLTPNQAVTIQVLSPTGVAVSITHGSDVVALSASADVKRDHTLVLGIAAGLIALSLAVLVRRWWRAGLPTPPTALALGTLGCISVGCGVAMAFAGIFRYPPWLAALAGCAALWLVSALHLADPRIRDQLRAKWEKQP